MIKTCFVCSNQVPCHRGLASIRPITMRTGMSQSRFESVLGYVLRKFFATLICIRSWAHCAVERTVWFLNQTLYHIVLHPQCCISFWNNTNLPLFVLGLHVFPAYSCSHTTNHSENKHAPVEVRVRVGIRADSIDCGGYSNKRLSTLSRIVDRLELKKYTRSLECILK